MTRCLIHEGSGQRQWHQCSPAPSPESPRGWEPADGSLQGVVSVTRSAFHGASGSPTQQPLPMGEASERGQAPCRTGLRCDKRVATFKLPPPHFLLLKTYQAHQIFCLKEKFLKRNEGKVKREMVCSGSPAVSRLLAIDQAVDSTTASKLQGRAFIVEGLVTAPVWNLPHSDRYLLCQQSCQLHSYSSLCSPGLIGETQKHRSAGNPGSGAPRRRPAVGQLRGK